MAFNVLFGKSSGNKDSLSTTNSSPILGAAGLAFNHAKFNSSGMKPFSTATTERILHDTKPLNLEIDEGSDSSEDDDDETTESDSSSNDKVERVKPKSNVQKKKNGSFNNVNDIRDDKAPSITNKKPHAKVSATNIISDFSNFEFHSKLRALGGREGNENYAKSEITPRNKISKSETFNTVKSDFVSGPTANPPRIKTTNMMPIEEQSYNRSDIHSDVSWGSDPGQQQQSQPPPQITSPSIKVNPKFIIENQSFTPNFGKISPYINNTPSRHHTDTNEWNTRSSDSRSEVVFRGKDKVVSSRHNYVVRNPRFNSSVSPGIPKTMSDVTYQPKELRTEVSHYSHPEYSSYGGDSYQRKPSAHASYSVDENIHPYPGAKIINQQQQQHKPRVIVEPQRKVASFAQLNRDEEKVDHNDIVQNEEEIDDEEIDEEPDEEIDELLNMTEDTNIQRKLLELHISNKQLLTVNKSLEENINEQSSELENFSSFDSLLKAQKEQLEHITNLENIIKDLTTKLSEQEAQIKKIKDDNNEGEEDKKTKVTIFYDPRNLPLYTLPRIIYDRVYDDATILYSVIKSLLYTFYIFPILILFRVTRKVLEKSKTKFVEITTE